MLDPTIDVDAPTMAPDGRGGLLAGRYRVVKPLGQGGMGSVWLAEDTQLDGRPCAIKMLPSVLVSNARAYRQLKNEALVAMKLSHPNIVTLRAFEDNGGNPFLVMDYIAGRTLDAYLEEAGPLPADKVLALLKPVAAALDYAHTQGVVHRDVKPANVMVRQDGTPFVLDFGIAREMHETMTRVTGKSSSGTLFYMSPEQLNGATPKPAQDVYSFAAMAYECLKGEPPFCRGAIEHQILNMTPEPPPGPAPLVQAILRGLAKTPEARPKTCLGVLDHAEPVTLKAQRNSAEVQGGRAARPLAAAEAQSGGNAEVRRRGVGRVAWVVALMALIAAGGYGIWQQHETSARAQAEARERLRVAEAEQKARERAAAREAEEKARRTQTEQEADNGHEKVQLWEGGPYWATTNIGANQPWEYGLYFWWGDTTGQRLSGTKFGVSFERLNCLTSNKSIAVLLGEGWIVPKDGTYVLTPEHDAAHAQWGGAWRMPTKQELDDLSYKCDWTWTKWSGVIGFLVRGRGRYAEKSIFLPAVGYGDRASLYYAGSLGYFWSSVPFPDDNSFSRYLGFDSGGHGTGSTDRYDGLAVRPVQGFTNE